MSGSITINPENVDRARELAVVLMEKTRAEAGCLSYGFYADLEEPGRFVLYEEWASKEEMDAHSASDHLAEFMAGTLELDIRSAAIDQYTVTDHVKVM